MWVYFKAKPFPFFFVQVLKVSLLGGCLGFGMGLTEEALRVGVGRDGSIAKSLVWIHKRV